MLILFGCRFGFGSNILIPDLQLNPGKLWTLRPSMWRDKEGSNPNKKSKSLRGERTSVKKNRQRLIGALAVMAFVVLAFGLVNSTALADPGGGQVVAIQKANIVTSPPSALAPSDVAIDASPPAASVVNSNGPNTSSATATINASPTTTAANQTISTATVAGQAITTTINSNAGTVTLNGGNNDAILPINATRTANGNINIVATTASTSKVNRTTTGTLAQTTATNNEERFGLGPESVTVTANQNSNQANTPVANMALNSEGVACFGTELATASTMSTTAANFAG